MKPELIIDARAACTWAKVCKGKKSAAPVGLWHFTQVVWMIGATSW